MKGRKQPIRVLVVDDSITIRKMLVEVLAADPDLRVVGEAADGRQGVELCERLRPDVVTMDMMMPGMTGLAATEQIMAFRPTPILVVSASSNRGEALETFDALAAGATDAIEKPLGDEPIEDWGARLRAGVKRVSRIAVISHPRARLAQRDASARPRPAAAPAHDPRVVLIGGSTGAPAAVARILHGLSASYPLPIIVIIHISSAFAQSLTDWLATESPIPVSLARAGERPQPGHILVAPPDRHLIFRDGQLALLDAPERHSCRPAIDELFESAARERGPQTIACLLTGMGRDGAAGLLAIREAGGETLVQDEATSVVFGMPGEAVRLGAARRVLPLPDIAPALIALTKQGRFARAS